MFWDIYNTPKEERLSYSKFAMNCPDSLVRNKAKRFLNMSAAKCSTAKIRKFSESTFTCEPLFFCKVTLFVSFTIRKLAKNRSPITPVAVIQDTFSLSLRLNG